MKWFKWTVLIVLGIPLVAVAMLYAWSEVIINREYRAESRSMTFSTNPDVISVLGMPSGSFAVMTDGTGLGGRDLGLMTEVARNRFRHLAQAEVEALFAYLQSR